MAPVSQGRSSGTSALSLLKEELSEVQVRLRSESYGPRRHSLKTRQQQGAWESAVAARSASTYEGPRTQSAASQSALLCESLEASRQELAAFRARCPRSHHDAEAKMDGSRGHARERPLCRDVERDRSTLSALASLLPSNASHSFSTSQSFEEVPLSPSSSIQAPSVLVTSAIGGNSGRCSYSASEPYLQHPDEVTESWPVRSRAVCTPSMSSDSASTRLTHAPALHDLIDEIDASLAVRAPQPGRPRSASGVRDHEAAVWSSTSELSALGERKSVEIRHRTRGRQVSQPRSAPKNSERGQSSSAGRASAVQEPPAISGYIAELEQEVARLRLENVQLHRALHAGQVSRRPRSRTGRGGATRRRAASPAQSAGRPGSRQQVSRLSRGN